MSVRKERICTAWAAWGCFPGLAPPDRPRRYHCLLARDHDGDHVVEVAGTRQTFPRAVRGGVRVGAGRPPTLDDGRDVTVAVRLSGDEAERLDEVIAREGETRSETIRRLIRGARAVHREAGG